MAGYCPEGSASPTSADPSYYTVDATPNDSTDDVDLRVAQVICPAGFQCSGGVKSPCGSAAGYCPEGSASPTSADPGYYTVDGAGGVDDTTHRVSQVICPVGFQCSGGVKSPCGTVAGYCPEGSASPTAADPGYYTVDATPNDSTDDVDLRVAQTICPAGFQCSGGVKSPCGSAAGYCPEGSASPTSADPGYYTVDGAGGVDDTTHRVGQVICPRGQWCSGGVQIACGAGRYGSSLGMTSDACSGLCDPGMWMCGCTLVPRLHV